MAKAPDLAAHAKTFDKLREVRAGAIEHYRIAMEMHGQRRALLETLIKAGFSQADIAREMGVTRQAVQKWLA